MSKTTTEMQLVPITKLVPYQNNARTHSAEQIKKLRSSLREFGFVNPVLIDRSFGVIAGHEPVLYGWKKSGKHQWYTGRKETTIWEFDKPKKNGDHPTMKPIPLLAYPIMNSSMTNSIILDPFGGSGSTLIACEQSGRICFTSEIDEKFCDVIVKRFIEQVGSSKKVSVIRDGQTLSFDEVQTDGTE